MSGNFTNKADPLRHRTEDSGYRVGWRYKYKFEKGFLDGEMTYGEAKKKAAELQAKEPEKAFYPEMIME